MRLLDDRPERLATIAYKAAGPGRVQTLQLPVERLRVDTLPDGCQALLATGDLQGIAPSPFGGEPELLGIAVADYLGVWAESGLLPPPERVGVLLTGDLYSAPQADVRGASGAVSDVWLAFAAAGCPFVVGVAGNHDVVSKAQIAELAPNTALLDGDRRRLADLTIAGIGGVIGDPARPMRRAEKSFLALVASLAAPPTDVLLLHEGPSGDEADQLGNAAVRATLKRLAPPLTFCGHVHWQDPVATLGSGHVINVDARVAVLMTR